MSNMVLKRKPLKKKAHQVFEEINFSETNAISLKFALFLESHFNELEKILLQYETFEVVKDEFERTIDLLTHLSENVSYFSNRIGPVTSFLPKNQPLYSLCCFVIVPSLLATEVHFRPPHAMKEFYDEFINVIKLKRFFPNIYISKKNRLDFLEERTATLFYSDGHSEPVTHAVIFTGNKESSDRLRKAFDDDVLFISNGSGHNPIVVTETANVERAVESALSIQLYNQGQDCSSPNAILVHKKLYTEFLNILKKSLKNVQVGQYSNKKTRVGPISEPKDLVRITSILLDNSDWIDADTPARLSLKDGVIEPTVVTKPLREGGNFEETFAPVFFVQRYDSDNELSKYFEDPSYAVYAMYISLYGASLYVENLVGKKINGRILHDEKTIIRNSDPHVKGFERGTQEYGGYGTGTSSVSYKGKIFYRPTLPQREIFEFLVEPLLRKGLNLKKNKKGQSTKIIKNLEKYFGMKSEAFFDAEKQNAFDYEHIYYDFSNHSSTLSPIHQLKKDKIHTLLMKKNQSYALSMTPDSLSLIRELKDILEKSTLSPEKIKLLLYSIPKKKWLSEIECKKAQKQFFVDLYNLLLGKDHGPRLYSLLFYANKNKVNDLLNI